MRHVRRMLERGVVGGQGTNVSHYVRRLRTIPKKKGSRMPRKKHAATMAEVLAYAKKAEHLTSDPVRVVEPTGEGEELRTIVRGLIDDIIHLPRAAETLQKRLARAEAENVRLACHRIEWCDESRATGERDWKQRMQVVIQELDIALVKFSILAR